MPASRLQLLAAACIITVIFLYRNPVSPHSYYYCPHGSRAHGPSVPFNASHHLPANATLGFGVILAVSGHGSPRKPGLVQAANVTDIELVVPVQPKRTEEDVDDFRLPGSSLRSGSIKAWLGHRDALQWFLRSGLETALILEDDVDWDIHLRTLQIPAASHGIRSLLPRAPPRYYWGNPKDWDLLYLGHCGDFWNPIPLGYGVGHFHPEDLDKVAHVLEEDASVPARYHLHPYTASFLTALGVPEHTRLIHASKFPLCSFGYAVTRKAAKLLLDDIAPAHEVKDTAAYDVAILNGCMKHGLRCWTVNPELFHHMPGKSLIDSVDAKAEGVENGKPPIDVAAREQTKYRKETVNIGCGFWNKDFQFGDDMRKLAFLREEVGRKGKCLKPKKSR